MNCGVCARKNDVGEMVNCNGCKAGYHYKCVNITSAAFGKTQIQLKRTFKCDSCSNVTKRIRVTDDTPVRGAGASAGNNELNQSFEGNISQAIAESLTTDEIVHKINSAFMAKLSAFETSIICEIKATVAVLALENSKLRQELKEANMKCNSYEQQIKDLESEKQLPSKKNQHCDVVTNSQILRSNRSQISTTPVCSIPIDLPSTSNMGIDTQVPALPKTTKTSYAAVATKAADTNIGDSNGDGWIEVKNKRRTSIKRGGNNSIASLKAVERKKFIHVWRLEKCTTEDNLKDFIKQILGNDSEIVIEKLKPKTERDYASFKIGVASSNFEKLCDPELWPVNVEFSEWVWFRQSTKYNKVETE